MLRLYFKNECNYASSDLKGVAYLILKRGELFILYQLSFFLLPIQP